jgi:hypothetical protein
MKYNILEKTINKTKFVFVTRGKAKPFTEDEVQEFLDETEGFDYGIAPVLDEKPQVKDFVVPDSLKTMFLKDLRQKSMKFCVGKYGATKEQICSEAQRLAPYMNHEMKE